MQRGAVILNASMLWTCGKFGLWNRTERIWVFTLSKALVLSSAPPIDAEWPGGALLCRTWPAVNRFAFGRCLVSALAYFGKFPWCLLNSKGLLCKPSQQFPHWSSSTLQWAWISSYLVSCFLESFFKDTSVCLEIVFFLLLHQANSPLSVQRRNSLHTKPDHSAHIPVLTSSVEMLFLLPFVSFALERANKWDTLFILPHHKAGTETLCSAFWWLAWTGTEWQEDKCYCFALISTGLDYFGARDVAQWKSTYHIHLRIWV